MHFYQTTTVCALKCEVCVARYSTINFAVLNDLENLEYIRIKSSEDQRVVDGPQDQFKGYEGDHGPYFQNFTSCMLFIWVTKHMICKYVATLDPFTPNYYTLPP
jgi:hypothetical protein